MIHHHKSKMALLGSSLRAIEAIDKFNRDYLFVAPDWAESAPKENHLPYVAWNFERLNERSGETAGLPHDEGVEVALSLHK